MNPDSSYKRFMPCDTHGFEKHLQYAAQHAAQCRPGSWSAAYCKLYPAQVFLYDVNIYENIPYGGTSKFIHVILRTKTILFCVCVYLSTRNIQY